MRVNNEIILDINFIFSNVNYSDFNVENRDRYNCYIFTNRSTEKAPEHGIIKDCVLTVASRSNVGLHGYVNHPQPAHMTCPPTLRILPG